MHLITDTDTPYRFPVTARMRAEAREDRQDAMRAKLQTQFAEAVKADDVATAVTFAPACISTVSDLIADALSYRPEYDRRALQVLIDAAAGRPTQQAAQKLLADIGANWADREADAA